LTSKGSLFDRWTHTHLRKPHGQAGTPISPHRNHSLNDGTVRDLRNATFDILQLDTRPYSYIYESPSFLPSKRMGHLHLDNMDHQDGMQLSILCSVLGEEYKFGTNLCLVETLLLRYPWAGPAPPMRTCPGTGMGTGCKLLSTIAAE
jgi:hypothetical protein